MNQMPDWILVPLVLLFATMAVTFLVYPEVVRAKLERAISRHKISGWLFFKDALRIRITGLLYLGAVIGLLYWRSQG